MSCAVEETAPCETCDAVMEPQDLTEDSAGRKVCDHCLDIAAQLGAILNS